MAAEVRIIVGQQGNGSAVADAKKDVAELGQTAEKSGGGFSVLREIGIGALRELGAAATNAALGGLKALGGAIMEGIGDAREAAKINAQTGAVLKSTGNAAGTSAEHIQDYAAALSAAAGKSLFGDSQIQESTNLLLTFTNIKGTVLDAATAISVDMAQALGGAPKDSAIQLGKALNDPIKGVTALTRVGVTFSQEQKDMIQALVETGDVAGAQKVILAELSKEFGGSAEAAAKADGGWVQFNDRMGEAKETVGAAILPLLGLLAGVLNDTIAPAIETAATTMAAWLGDPAVQAQLQAIGEAITTGIGAAFSFLADVAIPALIGAWQTLAPVIQPVIASFTDAKSPVDGLINTLAQVSPVFALVKAGIEAALPPIRDIVLTVFGIIQGFIAEHGEKIRFDLMSAWQQIQAIIEAVTPPIQAIIGTIFGAIAEFLHAHGDDIRAFLGQTWDAIAEIINLALQLIQAIIVPAFEFVAGLISSHGDTIQALLSNAWAAIKLIVDTALTLIRGILTAAMQAIHGDWSGAWNTIKTMSATVVQNIFDLFKLGFEQLKILIFTIWNAIKLDLENILNGIVGFVIQTMLGIANAIRDFGSQAAGAASSLGSAIVGGIADGIKNGASAIVNAAKDAAMAALNAAKSALGISSPSKVFADSVGLPMAQGMVQGMIAGAPMVVQTARDVAGAAVSGGRSVTNNRNFTYQPTINNFGGAAEALDMRTAASLAGL